MIALCFSMCREIGENHEAAACIQLKLIESRPWGERRLKTESSGRGLSRETRWRIVLSMPCAKVSIRFSDLLFAGSLLLARFGEFFYLTI